MINATSPAAKSSRIQTDAISANETSTSALISNSVTRPITASRIIGIPQKMIATHAGSTGNAFFQKILLRSAIPERTRNVMSFFVPPVSRSCSNFFVKDFILMPPIIPIWVYVYLFSIIPIGVYVVNNYKNIASQIFDQRYLFPLFYNCCFFLFSTASCTIK